MENNSVYAYIRVSTDLQDNSVEVQEKRIREYCEFKHLHLVDIFTDEGVSGSVPIDKRPEGSKLCALLTKDVKGLICVKPDRLFRSTVDALTSVEKWDKLGIELHVVDLNGATLNTKTASGKLIFTILIAYASFEREQTGERIKAVLNNKKESKKTYSARVLGYDNVEGHMVPNIEEQEIINYIKILHAKEYGPTRIAKALNRFGYRTKTKKKFFPSTVQAVMGNTIHKQVNVDN